MCGILALWCRESVPSEKAIDYLISEAEVRGQSATGIAIIDPEEETYVTTFRSAKPYSRCKDLILSQIKSYLKKGNILLVNCRNAPETENITLEENIPQTVQPITYRETVLVHNGAISSSCVKEYEKEVNKKITIDSQVIAYAYYKHNKNLKNALENIHGGWSFIMYDHVIKRLFIGSSFIPLAHGYIRGVGYIVHSSLSAIRSFVGMVRRSDNCRVTSVWEDYYFNELKEYSIHEIDIDSGLIREYSYKHNFIHPVWKQDDDLPSAAIVLSSGGIDSTCSLILAKKYLKVPTFAINISYGQKSQEAEKLAVQKICNYLGITPLFLDMTSLFNKISSTSMLMNDDIPIRTGMQVKTTQSWVPNRNGMFLNVALAYAEHLILSNQFSKIQICGGFPNISEESVFPDNSQRFVDSFIKMSRFSSLSGAQNRIRYSNLTGGITKTEELIIFKHFECEDLFGLTVSCDRAIIKDGKVLQCWKGDFPACGSGKLSWWAAKKAGIKDTREYYEVDDPDYEHYVPEYIKDNQTEFHVSDFSDIVCRLIL